MNVLESLYKEIQEIKNDKVSGSSQIALKSLDIVTATIDLETYGDELYPKTVANMIKNSKPAMAAVHNICDYAILDYKKHIKMGKKYFYKNIRNKMLSATQKTIENSYNDLFKKNDTEFYSICTCSYSSIVVKLVKFAAAKGKKIKLFLLESIWNDINYSKQIAEEFKNTGIITQIITADEFIEIKNKLDFCIIGADGYDYEQNVVNGVPSLQLAELIFPDKLLYVVAESFKKIKHLNTEDGFQFIPSKYITKIISDDDNWYLDE